MSRNGVVIEQADGNLSTYVPGAIFCRGGDAGAWACVRPRPSRLCPFR